MKAQYKTASGRLTFEVQGENPKEVFRQISLIQDVFDAETECGCCQTRDIRFQVRDVEGNEYYELVCLGCHAKFAFGQLKKGQGLFPKRKDAEGPLPNRGWFKWTGKTTAWGGEEFHEAPPDSQ